MPAPDPTLRHVIVVIGPLAWDSHRGVPTGRAAEVAIDAARRGRAVEVIARIGDDHDGDRLLVELSRLGVGHAAVLRDPAHPTPLHDSEDPLVAADQVSGEDLSHARSDDRLARAPTRSRIQAADIALALEYLDGIRVVVVDAFDPDAEASLNAVLAGAAYHAAEVIVMTAVERAVPGATVLVAALDGDDSTLATVAAAIAAGVDDGRDPSEMLATFVD